MDIFDIIILLAILAVVMIIGGIALIIKGIRTNKAHTGWAGGLLLSVVALIAWFFYQLSHTSWKVGG